ncbi:dCTP deaminase/dUTPase family protein [Rhizobium ruizarguesonis]
MATTAANSGDRIAQLIIAPVKRARFDLSTKISDSSRGAEGLGSAGS